MDEREREHLYSVATDQLTHTHTHTHTHTYVCMYVCINVCVYGKGLPTSQRFPLPVSPLSPSVSGPPGKPSCKPGEEERRVCVCVCVYVCVCERKREREGVCVCVYVYVCL